jgi:5-(hydroxymethyl)furfural/furfural oxidase
MTKGHVDAQSFDVIIVGAGASGCVLAGRLSEVPEKRVLLIEAGPDAPAGQEHADIRDPFPVSYGNPRFCWPGLTAETGADPGNGSPRSSNPYLQGYGVGGGSNINGMAADRGQPEDYDEWRNYGVAGWAWDDVLPYFNKLEWDLDFSGPLHGDSGPMPVRRVRPASWAPFSKAVGQALQRHGYPLIEDFNADFRDGVSSVPMSCLPDQRVSASMAYLTTTVRRRPNLTILTDTVVERLDVGEGHVRGVVARNAAGPRQFRAHEIIVACGALQSPTLLMRSGIGPGQHLRELGIEVIRDLPGVGRNLQNHPVVMLVTHLPRAAMQPLEHRPWQQNHLRYSSKCEACPENDMLIIPFNKVAWHPLGRRIGTLIVYATKAYSKGCVDLVSRDSAIAPRIQFNLLSDSRDFERLVGGVRFALQLLADKDVARVRNEVFLPNGNIIARLSKRSLWNWLQAWVIAKIFDISFLRRTLLKKATLDVRALARDEDALSQFVRQGAQAVYHVCGTCRMGSANDPEAVVDSDCRVLGVDGLRVVDASVFPTVPSGNTHFPVLMVAEKMADQIKAEWRNGGIDNRFAAKPARHTLSAGLVLPTIGA